MKVLIFGAGAIGRGFIPLHLNKNVEINFVDINHSVINLLNKRKNYSTFEIKNGKYIKKKILVNRAYHINDKINIRKYDCIFLCVGVNEAYKLASLIKNAKNIICCENDNKLPSRLTKITGNKKIFLGIPDVITSNTASENHLLDDKLSVVSENGILVLENKAPQISKSFFYYSKKMVNNHWICKMLIHNTPHAICSYLGYEKKVKYIHEAMQIKYISKIVSGAINEITSGLIRSNTINSKFANYYKNKELKRFKNKLLLDPISRVSREPMRKLANDDRLVLGLRTAMFGNVYPKNTIKGFVSALKYKNFNDQEAIILNNLIKTKGLKFFLSSHCGINELDPLNKVILANYDTKNKL
jgi:mannitol-1-phosphate 5-dehydrogenase